MSEKKGHPKEIRDDIAKAKRLEWWNIAWTFTYVAALGLAMGSSQAMKTAWVEDMLGLIPPIAILISLHFEARAPNKEFHYGYDRVNSLGFLIAAVALTAVGLLLLWDSTTALLSKEHVSVGTTRIMGHDVWLGWFMLAAQAYATIPPLIIGRMELPLAKRLNDKLIHTDALMNKANWQTGVAGFVGIAGLGFGYWWTDAAAAIIISASIILDGAKSLRIASAELVDSIPYELGEDRMAKDAAGITKALKARFPDAKKILLRETGRYIRAEVCGAVPPKDFDPDTLEIDELGCRWRLDSVAFRP